MTSKVFVQPSSSPSVIRIQRVTVQDCAPGSSIVTGLPPSPQPSPKGSPTLAMKALKTAPKPEPDHKNLSSLQAKDSPKPDHKDLPKSKQKGSAKPEPKKAPPQSAQHGTVAASKSGETPPSPTKLKKHHQASLEVPGENERTAADSARPTSPTAMEKLLLSSENSLMRERDFMQQNDGSVKFYRDSRKGAVVDTRFRDRFNKSSVKSRHRGSSQRPSVEDPNSSANPAPIRTPRMSLVPRVNADSHVSRPGTGIRPATSTRPRTGVVDGRFDEPKFPRLSMNNLQNPLGVSIEFIRKFIADNSHLSGFAEFTTLEVCDRIVKPLTKSRHFPFLELFRDQRDENGKLYVGPATAFVSHAWKYKFCEPVDVMEQFTEEEDPAAYFWFDLFINDQNIAAKLPYEWWKTTFMETISSIGTVLLVLSPWNDPVPITRAWCLWEIMCALGQPNVDFVVMLPRNQAQALKEGVVKQPRSIVQALADIQSEKADAFQQHDKEMIFKTITETIGFSFVNQKVKEQLRAWYVQTLKEMADFVASGSSEEDAHLLSSVAFVLNAFGFTDEALVYDAKDLSISLALHGHLHKETASSYNNMGSHYDNKGDFAKAIEYHSKALDIRIQLLGKTHPDTGSSYNNLGAAFLGKGDYDTALEYYKQTLAINLSTVGEDHPDTATTYNNLGLACRKLGRIDKAIEFYNLALNTRLATVGAKHPDTALVYNNIGAAYDCKGDYDQAIRFYEKDLAICTEVLGPRHPDTASSCSNIGASYNSKGDYPRAIAHHQKALEIRIEALGKHHPETAQSYNNLATAYYDSGDYDKAIEYYNTNLEICQEVVGENDGETANVYSNLGSAYEQKGCVTEALDHYCSAETIKSLVFGPDSIEAAGSYFTLGMIYLEQGSKKMAVEKLQRAVKIRERELSQDDDDLVEALVALEEAMMLD